MTTKQAAPATPLPWAILHRPSKQYFGGFESGPEFTPIWVPASKATTWAVKEHAVSQAYLLRLFGHSVQIKPEQI